MKRQLSGMVVIVTGASSGIGRRLAEDLSRSGAHLVLAARREWLLEEFNAQHGGRHVCIASDISSPETASRLVAKAVDRFGRIDTVVCNAGYGLINPVATFDDEALEKLFRTNVFGTLYCVRAAIPVMQSQSPRDGSRGQIVFVSSAAAKRGLPFFGHYAATKAAQLSLAEALRVEMRSSKIDVTTILPIGTETEFFKAAQSQSKFTMAPRRAGELWQDVDLVARRIAAAIEAPRPEVWTSLMMRVLLNVGGLMPTMLDWIMAKDLRKYLRKSHSTGGG